MGTKAGQSGMADELRKEMTRQHYKIVGRHSAVKLCTWLKKSLRGGGSCYKQRFYGIQSHRCLQMTPWLGCCNQCVFCWRIIEKSPASFGGVDEPKDIIDGCVEAQRKLINGFPGWEGTNMVKWKEANNPNQAAISLIGEPTMYPKISGLIGEFKKRGFTTFLVTNGQLPERLERIEQPTQLYISLDAPDRKTYKTVDQPRLKDYWSRLERSLEIMKGMSCRTVIRLTLTKGVNMKDPEGYAKLIARADPDFIEAKAYMHVGESQKRLPRDAMPRYEEVTAFSEKLSEATGYSIKDEQKPSRVVLLSRK